MVATVTFTTVGRLAPLGDLAAIPITITGVSTAYLSSTGGLPFDLADVLNNAGEWWGRINPLDIVGVLPLGMSASKYLPLGFTLGTPTYADLNVGGQAYPNGTLATCPCTIRLIGIASATNHDPLGETADTTNSDSFTAALIVARGGPN